MSGVLVWVQHLLGTGHLRRALTIAEALAEAGMPVTLVSGGGRVPWRPRHGVTVVQLPPITTADASFRKLLGPGGEPVGEALWTERRAMLLDLLESTRPAALVTEMFPFGRRAFRAELLPLLERAHGLRPRPWILASLRDVLVSKSDPAKLAAMRDLALRWYDRVLVHGDPRLIPLDATFPLAADIADRVTYTGYVHGGGVAPTGSDRREVLVSAGGGAVGRRLLETATATRPLSRLADRPWRLIAGANLPEADLRVLREKAPAGVIVEHFRDDLQELLTGAVVSVSQAGYNTVVETLAARTPMVLAPFAAEGEDEQTVRARRLRDLGSAEMVEETELTPDRLARAVDRAAMRGPAASVTIRTDGAERTARIVRGLLERGAPDG